MTNPLNQANSNIASKAMIVNLSISVWPARRFDKKVTNKVAVDNHVNSNVGRYNKALLPVDAPSYKSVISAASAARTEHYKQTLPWSDEGSRILPATNYLEYTSSIRSLRSTFDTCVQDFLDDYPSLIAKAQSS